MVNFPVFPRYMYRESPNNDVCFRGKVYMASLYIYIYWRIREACETVCESVYIRCEWDISRDYSQLLLRRRYTAILETLPRITVMCITRFSAVSCKGMSYIYVDASFSPTFFSQFYT